MGGDAPKTAREEIRTDMGAHAPDVLALDFDGVLCDGMAEYFEASWRACRAIWPQADAVPPAGLAARFARLRPVVETGWEMPLVLRAILRGETDTAVFEDWPAVTKRLLETEHVTVARLRDTLDQVRDEWIARDLASWLGHHRFYPGVIDWLRRMAASRVRPIIISTKDGRFVRALLRQEGVSFGDGQVMGKEVGRSKPEVLRDLIGASVDDLLGGQALLLDHQCPPSVGRGRFWFVEDRFETLARVATEPSLDEIRLFLAAWGYNTEANRDAAQRHPRIRLLSLTEFTGDLAGWPAGSRSGEA